MTIAIWWRYMTEKDGEIATHIYKPLFFSWDNIQTSKENTKGKKIRKLLEAFQNLPGKLLEASNLVFPVCWAIFHPVLIHFFLVLFYFPLFTLCVFYLFLTPFHPFLLVKTNWSFVAYEYLWRKYVVNMFESRVNSF